MADKGMQRDTPCLITLVAQCGTYVVNSVLSLSPARRKDLEVRKECTGDQTTPPKGQRAPHMQKVLSTLMGSISRQWRQVGGRDGSQPPYHHHH